MPSEDSKGVKKEEAGEESLGSMLQAQKKNLKTNKVKNAGTSSSTLKHLPTAAKTSNKVKEEPQDDDDDVPIKCKVGSKPAKVKKEENVGDEDSKPTSRRASATTTKDKSNKKKNKIEEAKKKTESATPEQNGKKREKKVYDLPGQKRDPPEERDPLRIFYESLFKQVPNSEMAQIWMMESGLLAKELARKIFEKKQKKNPKLSSPLKAVSASKNAPSTSARKKIATSPVSSAKKKITDSKSALKQSNKGKVADESSEDSDDDFVVATRITKKPRVS